jgi:hypothetical protein
MPTNTERVISRIIAFNYLHYRSLAPVSPWLTVDDSFANMISGSDNLAHPHDDALAPSPFVDPRLAAYSALHYKFHNTAPRSQRFSPTVSIRHAGA